MKHLLIASILLLVLNTNSNAQTTDTAGYLQNTIIANKALYINQKASVLFNALQIQPIEYFGSKFTKNIEQETSLSLYFGYSAYKNYPPRLKIVWQTPASGSASELLYDQTKGAFNAAAKIFYKDQVIADIQFIPAMKDKKVTAVNP